MATIIFKGPSGNIATVQVTGAFEVQILDPGVSMQMEQDGEPAATPPAPVATDDDPNGGWPPRDQFFVRDSARSTPTDGGFSGD